LLINYDIKKLILTIAQQLNSKVGLCAMGRRKHFPFYSIHDNFAATSASDLNIENF
jgi:hypothetical protein